MRVLMLALVLLPRLSLAAADRTPLIRGHFDLVDCRTGLRVSQDSYQDHCRLVFFGFTHCPLTCPLGLRTVEKILSKLGKDAAKVNALFITIDPGRDTAQAMTAYLSSYDPRITGLIGNDKSIAAAMREFRLEAERMGTGDDYVLEHPAIIYLMDRKGSYLRTFPSNGDAAGIALDVRTAMGKDQP